jgi:hypothetical protein
MPDGDENLVIWQTIVGHLCQDIPPSESLNYE